MKVPKDTKVSIKLSDPKALRAYAHPTRMMLVGLLRTEGPLTATRAADLIGESVASCSYHLRVLAKYRLVEEAGGGQGREKPWRATARVTEIPGPTEDPVLNEATSEVARSIAELYFKRMLSTIETRHLLAPDWQEAEHFGDTLLYTTSEELISLNSQIADLIAPYSERLQYPELRPEAARLVNFLTVTSIVRGKTSRETLS